MDWAALSRPDADAQAEEARQLLARPGSNSSQDHGAAIQSNGHVVLPETQPALPDDEWTPLGGKPVQADGPGETLRPRPRHNRDHVTQHRAVPHRIMPLCIAPHHATILHCTSPRHLGPHSSFCMPLCPTAVSLARCTGQEVLNIDMDEELVRPKVEPPPPDVFAVLEKRRDKVQATYDLVRSVLPTLPDGEGDTGQGTAPLYKVTSVLYYDYGIRPYRNQTPCTFGLPGAYTGKVGERMTSAGAGHHHVAICAVHPFTHRPSDCAWSTRFTLQSYRAIAFHCSCCPCVPRPRRCNLRSSSRAATCLRT